MNPVKLAHTTIQLLVCALGLSGCAPAPTPDVELDLRQPCEAFSQVQVEPNLTPGSWTLQLSGDRHTEAPAWAITLGDNGFALQRLADPRPEAPAPETLSLSSPNHARLHSGPVPGETWLVIDTATEFWLYQLDRDGLVRSSGNLDAEFVDSTFQRDLIFIGDTPFVVGIPRSSATSEYEVWIGELTGDLTLGTSWSLELRRTCPSDLPECPTVSFPSIDLLDNAEPDGTSPALLLLGYDEILDDARTMYVATLRIGFDGDSQRPIALRREFFPRQVWPVGNSLQAHIAPAQLARDATGYYVLAGLTQESLDDPSHQLDAVVVRFDRLSDTASAPYMGLPTYSSPHLLQLDTRVALGQIAEGSWHIAPLYAKTGSNFEIDLDNLSSLNLEPAPSTGFVVVPGKRSQYVHRAIDGREIQTLVTCQEDAGTNRGLLWQRASAAETMSVHIPREHSVGVRARP